MDKPTGIAVLLTSEGNIEEGCVRLDFKNRESAKEVFDFAFKYGIYLTTFPTYFEDGDREYIDDNRSK